MAVSNKKKRISITLPLPYYKGFQDMIKEAEKSGQVLSMSALVLDLVSLGLEYSKLLHETKIKAEKKEEK